MNKTFKFYGIIFIIVMAVLVLLEFSKNEVTDWSKNFETDQKSPFGLYVFDQETKTIFKNKILKINQSPYEYYSQNKKKQPHNLLIILKEMDDESVEKILDHVSKGSDAFIVSDYMYRKLADSLNIPQITEVNYEETNTLKLTDIKFKNDSLYLDKMPDRYGFKGIDDNTEILGITTNTESDEKGANFIKTQFGKGNIYIHTEPLFLTNYYLLKPGNHKYAEDVFSYLPDREMIWFTDSGVFQSGSAMRFIFSKPALKYAWWLFLAGLVLFTFFNAKRRQRIIPIITPLKNKSVEFIKSIGNLYLQEGDFHDMMAKKSQYFLHKVRTELLIDTHKLDEEFAKKIHLKTGKNLDEINQAIVLMKKGNDPYAQVMQEDLITLNRLLDGILR